MTFDIAVDSELEVFINSRGDLAAVSGRDGFEQELALRLILRLTDLIGEVDDENIPDLLLTHARRVAAQMERLDSVHTFDITESGTQQNTYEFTVVYDTGEELTFEVEPQ